MDVFISFANKRRSMRLSLFILFPFFFHSSFSQPATRLDTVRQLLKTAKGDTSQLLLLNELAWHLRNSKGDSSILIAEQVLKRSEKLEWDKGIAKSCHTIGTAYLSLGQHDKAIPYFERAIETWKKMDPAGSKNEGVSWGNLALVYMSQGNNNKAIETFDKANELCKRTDNTIGLARNYSNMAVLYREQGNYSKALEYSFKALKVAEEKKYTELQANTLSGISTIYLKQQNFDKALEYATEGLNVALTTGDERIIGSFKGSIGNVYQGKKLLKKALDYYTEALASAEKVKSLSHILTWRSNMASVYVLEKDHKKAIEEYLACLQILDEYKIKDQIYCNTLQDLGVAYEGLKQYDMAAKSLEASIPIAKELSSASLIMNGEFGLYHIEYERKNYKSALEHYSKYITWRDSVVNTQNTKKQTEIEMQFAFDKKQTADSIKVAEEKRVSAAELKSERNTKYSLYAGMGLILVFAAAMYNRFKVTQNQKKLIEKQKVVVEEQKMLVEEKQKEIIDSITYARRIQRALITSEKYIEKNLNKLNKNRSNG